MPGELLPTMAAPGISKAKLSRAKADLYLIVSKS
jgi:pre-mRNA-splicing factor SYF1